MDYTESSLGEGFVMVLLDATPSPIGEPLAEAPSLLPNLDSDEPPLEERQAKEQAQQRAEQLEALLRTQGIDPDQPLGL